MIYHQSLQIEQRSAPFPFDVAKHGLKALLKAILESVSCKGIANVDSVVRAEEMENYVVTRGTYWSILCKVIIEFKSKVHALINKLLLF